MSTNLHRHATGNLAHRRQQRQGSRPIGDRLIGDAGGARLYQTLGLHLVSREMQVCEQDLPAPQGRDLRRLRFLDLHDQGGGVKHVRDDSRAGRLIGVVAIADACPGIGLNQNLMTKLGEFPNPGWGQPNTVFVGLHLLGDADDHESAPARHRFKSAAKRWNAIPVATDRMPLTRLRLTRLRLARLPTARLPKAQPQCPECERPLCQWVAEPAFL